MITVKSSEHHTGIIVSGDYQDMNALYDALHVIVGDEEEYKAYESARLRVLGVCYDIRHSLMGDREVPLIENGMGREMKKRLNVITPDHNLYFITKVIWPEMLFVLMALNDFVKLHISKLTKKDYRGAMHKNAVWDPSIAAIRQFQSAIVREIAPLVTPPTYARMMNVMLSEFRGFNRYTSQYVDVLNVEWIVTAPDKRLKALSSVAKRIAEKGDAYQKLRAQVQASAAHFQTTEMNISSPVDYPEEIEW